MSAEEMYQELIMDYYRNPRNFGTLQHPDILFRDTNPSCGDVIEMHVRVDAQQRIADIKFSGEGCAISQASASMLTEFLHGKPLDTVKTVTKHDVLGLLGVDLSPMRLKCALLSLKVVKYGTYAYLGQKMEENDAFA